MVSGLTGQTYEEKLRELNVPSLESRRYQYDMIQTFNPLIAIKSFSNHEICAPTVGLVLDL